MSDNHTYQRIEDYLLGQMSAAEKAAFQIELEQDAALTAQFRVQELEHKMMEALVEKDLLADLENWAIEDNRDGDSKIEQKPKAHN